VLYRAAQGAASYTVSHDMRHGGRSHRLFPIPKHLVYSENLNSERLESMLQQTDVSTLGRCDRV